MAIFCLFLVVACRQKRGDAAASSAGRLTQAPQIGYEILDTIPHDRSAFTEGLFFDKGKLYESTGLAGQTSIRVTDAKSGKLVSRYGNYMANVFGEGLSLLNDQVYQLTYRNNKVYVFAKDGLAKPIKELNWKLEGWGCTNNGKELILSDGSSQLYVVNPENFEVIRTIDVQDADGAVDQLNELEYIGGSIYANRWHYDTIYKIDPANGHVVGVMQLKGVLVRYKPQYYPGQEDVLNGIAWDEREQALYITGKNWPLFLKLRMTGQLR